MKKTAICCLLALAACSKDYVANIPAINGEILFISRRENNSSDWKLMLMNTNGSNQREVYLLFLQS